jgi:hypothetical protein
MARSCRIVSVYSGAFDQDGSDWQDRLELHGQLKLDVVRVDLEGLQFSALHVKTCRAFWNIASLSLSCMLHDTSDRIRIDKGYIEICMHVPNVEVHSHVRTMEGRNLGDGIIIIYMFICIYGLGTSDAETIIVMPENNHNVFQKRPA